MAEDAKQRALPDVSHLSREEMLAIIRRGGDGKSIPGPEPWQRKIQADRPRLMAYLLGSNLLIYSAVEDNEFLRPLVLDTRNSVSIISKVETLGFHKLNAADAIYFNVLFAFVNLLPVTPNIIDTAILLRQQQRM